MKAWQTKWWIGVVVLACIGICSNQASATLITDPNDPRTWQGAGVQTFANLFYGGNKQLVVDNQLLDDGIFDPTGFVSGTLLAGGGGCLGTSTDLTGTGDYNYFCGGGSVSTYANLIDNLWYQDSSVIGNTVFDLGFDATKAAVFPVIDHGPLPQESIESTVYLSNNPLGPWTQAVVERVWLEGFQPNTGILWDGFVFAVGTGTSSTFRYASIINGGPGAFQHDGDDEINGVMGLQANFTQDGGVVPEPASALLFGLGGLGAGVVRRRRRRV